MQPVARPRREEALVARLLVAEPLEELRADLVGALADRRPDRRADAPGAGARAAPSRRASPRAPRRAPRASRHAPRRPPPPRGRRRAPARSRRSARRARRPGTAVTAASARGRSAQPSGPATTTSVEWVWCSDSSRSGATPSAAATRAAVHRHRLALVRRARAAVQPGIDAGRRAAAAGEEAVPRAGRADPRSGFPASWLESGGRRGVVRRQAPERGRGFPFPRGGSSGDAPRRSPRLRRAAGRAPAPAPAR